MILTICLIIVGLLTFFAALAEKDPVEKMAGLLIVLGLLLQIGPVSPEAPAYGLGIAITAGILCIVDRYARKGARSDA
jgi:hypothetical protein